MNHFETTLVVTVIAGAVTGLGALPVFFRATVSHRTHDAALGLAAGLMIAASVFGLILPGMDEGGLAPVMIGVFLGGSVLLAGNRAIPHLHARYIGWRREGGADGGSPEQDSLVRRALLIAIVIGLQNVPDGFAFAVPMGETGISNARLLLYTTLSGLVPQVAAALFGFLFVSIAAGIFAIGAGFAAGAMMAVVFREMIPSSHGHGHADAATAAFLVGFALLVVVDELLVV